MMKARLMHEMFDTNVRLLLVLNCRAYRRVFGTSSELPSLMELRRAGKSSVCDAVMLGQTLMPCCVMLWILIARET